MLGSTPQVRGTADNKKEFTSSDNPTKVIIIRHGYKLPYGPNSSMATPGGVAQKGKGKQEVNSGPALTAPGEVLAIKAALYLLSCGKPNNIYASKSTDTHQKSISQREMQTAGPVVTMLYAAGFDVDYEHPDRTTQYVDLAKRIQNLPKGSLVFVIWEHKRINNLVNALTGKEMSYDWPETDFTSAVHVTLSSSPLIDVLHNQYSTSFDGDFVELAKRAEDYPRLAQQVCHLYERCLAAEHHKAFLLAQHQLISQHLTAALQREVYWQQRALASEAQLQSSTATTRPSSSSILWGFARLASTLGGCFCPEGSRDNEFAPPHQYQRLPYRS